VAHLPICPDTRSRCFVAVHRRVLTLLFRKGALLEAVDAYTIGHVTTELAGRETQRRERLSGPQWRTAMQAYLQRLLDSGDFPHLAGPGLDAGLSPADHQRLFDAGLDWLLTGFTTTLTDSGG
jgi:Tetracyclin repressor-like, C-terminal domain